MCNSQTPEKTLRATTTHLHCQYQLFQVFTTNYFDAVKTSSANPLHKTFCKSHVTCKTPNKLSHSRHLLQPTENRFPYPFSTWFHKPGQSVENQC